MTQDVPVRGLEQFGVLVEGLDHPEGLAVTPDGGTIYAGGEAGQVYRIDAGTRTVDQVASTGGFLLGVALDGNGRVYVCDIKRREVLRVNPESGVVEVFSSGTAERGMVNPNWGCFDAIGNYYVTDSGSWHGDDGCVFRVSPRGETEVWSTGSTNFPNGCCLDAASKNLLVLESCTPALVRLPIHP
ncbi:MAG: SMP-30/gluconolactonase/LRE family protein, partial [Candidatus Dormibacteria bacterium]